MNNFELHDQAQTLTDTVTPYQLAKKLIEATTLLDSFDRYEDTNFDYRQSPFCQDVRSWLKDNIKGIIPDADFADFD